LRLFIYQKQRISGVLLNTYKISLSMTHYHAISSVLHLPLPQTVVINYSTIFKNVDEQTTKELERISNGRDEVLLASQRQYTAAAIKVPTNSPSFSNQIHTGNQKQLSSISLWINESCITTPSRVNQIKSSISFSRLILLKIRKKA